MAYLRTLRLKMGALKRVFVWSMLMAIFVQVGNAQNADSERARCPDNCRCLSASRTIHCNVVAQVPQHALPDEFLTVNFCQDRPFASTVLYRSNTTRLVAMERIFMSRCGLETIEPGAFSEIRNLKTLDLSQNRLHTIAEYTFQGLQIETLFLGGNQHLVFDELSFAGLQVLHLKLDNCSLKQLDVDMILPLRSAGLRTLALPGNEISYLAPDLSDFIQSLQRIELQNNPFSCDCSMKWFIDLYQTRRQQNSELFGNVAKTSNLELYCNRSGADPSSAALLGRAFMNISTAKDLHCSQPLATDVRIEMTQNDWILVCAFEGNPMPSASIKSRNAAVANQFVRRLNASAAPQKRIEVNLPITGVDNTTGVYRCEAQNEIGSVSLNVDLSLPRVFYRALAMRHDTDAAFAARTTLRGSTQKGANEPTAAQRAFTTSPIRRDRTETDAALSAALCDSDKQFSVIEMIIAVVITFVGSSLLSFVIFRVAQSDSVGDFFKSARAHNYTLANGSGSYLQTSRPNHALEDADMQQQQQQQQAAASTNYNQSLMQTQLQQQAVNGSVSSQSFRSLPNPNGLGADGSLPQVHLAYRPQPPRPSRTIQPTFGTGVNVNGGVQMPIPAGYNTSMSINEFRLLNGVA